MESNIRNNQAEGRFELQIGGHCAFIDYRLDGQRMILVHTEVPQELGGQGIGGKIVKAALDYAKKQRLSVVPECPFAAQSIEKHKSYLGLVDNND